MRPSKRWSYKPYIPADEKGREKNPYICRLAPYKTSCELEWLGAGEVFYLYYTRRGAEEWEKVRTAGHTYCLHNLAEEEEYEFFVEDSSGNKSGVRLLRTGEVMGTVVNYLHPEDKQYGFSGQYLCSPSILRLPEGTLLASMDVYEGAGPQNLTLLFESRDRGAHWHYLTELFPCFWGKLFWHQNKIYMLGASREYGDLIIGCSDDGGKTWSDPVVLLRGSSSTYENGNHRAPVVILKSHGRLWTGTEYGSWAKNKFSASMLSIALEEDPMAAENWRFTDFVDTQGALADTEENSPGGIEGNAVELPDGRVVDIMRYAPNKALMLEVNWEEPEKAMHYCRVIPCPFGHTKFEIQRLGNVYYAIANQAPGRNVLALYESADGVNWEKKRDLINHAECDIQKAGFQYPSFCFDGNEILYLSRTAWNYANNFHDSNYITFHKTFLTEE